MHLHFKSLQIKNWEFIFYLSYFVIVQAYSKKKKSFINFAKASLPPGFSHAIKLASPTHLGKTLLIFGVQLNSCFLSEGCIDYLIW